MVDHGTQHLLKDFAEMIGIELHILGKVLPHKYSMVSTTVYALYCMLYSTFCK
jgi:hypothetical protein